MAYCSDISNNNLGNQITYNLPTNLQRLYVMSLYPVILFPLFIVTILSNIFLKCRNLAGNGFNGGIPYSISQMASLKYLLVIP